MDELVARHEDLREGPSKSQRKREMHALQTAAEQLTHLPHPELERLSLSPTTRAAINETARIRDLRALRRHYKHIAKLLIRENTEAVQGLLQESAVVARQEAARLHHVERWRERLITEGDGALSDFLDQCPDADRQQLRALIRTVRRDRERSKPDAVRKLFRFLREELNRAGIG